MNITFTQITNITNGSDSTSKENKSGLEAFCWSLLTINFLSIVLNGVVAKMLYNFRNKLLQSTSNRIILSLTIADVLVSCFGVNLSIMLLTGQSLTTYKIAGALPLFGSMFVSMTSLAIFTTDRLMALKMSLRYRNETYIKQVTRVIMLSWIVPLAITIMQALIYLYTASNTELKIRSAVLVAFFATASITLAITSSVLVTSLKRHNSILNEQELAPIKSLSLSSIQSSQLHLVAGMAATTMRNVAGQDDRAALKEPPKPDHLANAGHRNRGAVATEKKYLAAKTENEEENNLEIREKRDGLQKGFLHVQGKAKEAWKAAVDQQDAPQCALISNSNATPLCHATPHKFSDELGSPVTNASLGLVGSNITPSHTVTNNVVYEKAVARQRAKSMVRHKREVRVTVMCICIVIVFIMCWAPLTVYRLSSLVARGFYLPWLRRFALCLASSNSLLNPCTYLLVRKDFRRYLLKLCRPQ